MNTLDAPAMTVSPPTAAARNTATLWLLSLANFAVGMGAFVVIGILSPVAADLQVGVAQAGWLMTVYAVVYAVSSPLVVASTGAWDRARLLTLGMALFAAGALAAALSPNLTVVLAARGLMAVGAGIATPVAASIAVALSAPAERGRALAVVFGGLTLAQAIGVPAGAWLGYSFGWRAAFAIVALLSLAVVLVLARRLPRGIAVPVATLASLAAVLRTPRQAVAVSFTALFIGALYVFYTYMGPFIEARWQLGRDGVSLLLALFGAGAVVGNWMGGRLTDRIGSQRTLTLLASSQLVLLPLMTLVPMPLSVFAVLVAVWSVFCWSFMVPQQARLAALAPDRVPVLLALNAAAIYVGGSIGSALGGAALQAAGLSWLGVVAAAVALLALGSLFVGKRA